MANLGQIRRARLAAKAAGWKVRAFGKGNDQTLVFYGPNGHIIKVWYPWDGRVGDWEERDLEAVITFLGKEARQ